MKIPKHPFKVSSGLTLIELLITMAALAILVVIAAPSMDDARKKSSVRGHLRDFQSAVAFARGEAVSLARSVSICASANGSSCSANWGTGWIIFVEDGVADGVYDDSDDGEQLLRVYEYEGSNTLRVIDPIADGTPTLDSLTWTYRGFSDNAQRALAIVCESQGLAKYARGLLIASSGRAVTTTDSDGDLVHESTFEKDDGSLEQGDLSCP